MSLGIAAWIRRKTLFGICEHDKITERPVTVCLILQAGALFLMSPTSAVTVGRALHAVFRQWNLDTYAGHCLYLGAAGMLGVNVGSRLNISHDELCAAFRKWFQRPMTLAVAVLLALLVKSRNADAERPDLFDVATDYWLDTYWTVLCAFLILVVSGIVWVLRIVRRDPRSRGTADIYTAGCVCAIGICALRIFTTWHDYNCHQNFWLMDCTVGVILAYGAARSWLQRTCTAAAARS